MSTGPPSNLDAEIDALIAAGAADRSFDGTPLRACALAVLAEPDAERKALASFAIAAAFERGLLPLGAGAGASQAQAQALDRPARPENVRLVPPLRVKSSTRRHMLHALVHAESVAVDLAWDIVARFGWAPELWRVLPPDCGAAEVADEASDRAGGEESAGARDQPPCDRLPDDFFSTWVRVAAEEAKHFSKWRLRLLTYSGTRYGDLPAHDGLWQSAADTAHSLLARLSVVHCVHEARGLDVFPLMRGKLGDDAASVAVIDANHAEEVTHVEAGRVWLERVCARGAGASAGGDGRALDARRVFRACVRKYFFGGLRPPFAVETRARAGLTEDWWRELVVQDKAKEAQELDASDMG
jgi:uncharacterized ferritin-like protein (DUF455 family)